MFRKTNGKKEDKPDFPFLHKNEGKPSFAEAAVVEFFIVLITAIILLLVLNYFNIIPFSKIFPDQLGFLSHLGAEKNQSVVLTSTVPEKIQNPQNIPIFSCPVKKEDCSKVKSVFFNGSSALLYDVPAGDATTVSYYVLDSKEYSYKNLHGFSQAFIYNSMCYTISYLFSEDSTLANQPITPFGPRVKLATLGTIKFETEEQKGNLLLQLQKRPLDAPLKPKEELKSCNLTNLDKTKYGQYVTLSTDFFTND